MTIKEANEIIEKNPESFPSGLDTCYLDVLRFTVRQEIAPEAMKFRVSADRFSSLRAIARSQMEVLLKNNAKSQIQAVNPKLLKGTDNN